MRQKWVNHSSYLGKREKVGPSSRANTHSEFSRGREGGRQT